MCESDAGFLEELDVASTMQQEGSKNSRNIGSMSWYQTVQAFERHRKTRLLCCCYWS